MNDNIKKKENFKNAGHRDFNTEVQVDGGPVLGVKYNQCRIISTGASVFVDSAAAS